MRRMLSTLLLGAAFASTSVAFAAGPQVAVRPTARVTAKVDTKVTTQLAGTIPGRITGAKDLGRASGVQQMSFLRLVLKSTDAQEAALHELLDAQQDRNNPNFHKWETPDTFAANFGIATEDVQKVTDWLSASGLTVNSVQSGGRIITFSGSVAAIEAAFSTEMHNFSVDGETHISNATEVSVPAALADVMIGPAKLNDFTIKRSASFKKLVLGKDGLFYPVVPGTKNEPDYTSVSSGNHFVSPADFATIYNTKGLLSAGINGTGIKIGVVGRTLIDPADTQIFRSIFGLANNDPSILPGGDSPVVNGDDIEADLDVQWAGAVAPNAKVTYAPYGIQLFEGGDIDASALYYVNNNNVDIITMSYGGCEAGNGAAGTAEWNTIWEQAAAQGQSAFVSSGDSSATGCSSSSANTVSAANFVYAVNALGSSAYNVAVGGTMFNEGSYVEGLKKGVTKYWTAGGIPPYGTAASYIPESVMSDGAFNQVLGGAGGLAVSPGVFGGGGGVSQFTGRPSWQTGVGITAADPAGPTFTATGAIPAGTPHRLVPDVSLIGSLSHDDTIVCYESSCTTDPTTGLITGIGAVGGTSVATPVWASVMALIDQKNGGRQGNPNYFFYKLAAAEPSLAACASKEAPLPASTCNFNDIITGDNYSPRTTTGRYIAPVLDSTGTTIVTPGYVQGTLGTDYIGFAATTGYDEATGLGSPNVGNLATNWATVTFNATTTTLTLTPTTTTHGTSITATVKVTAASGTPTGDVAIIANTINGAAHTLTLSAGTASGSILDLPGGSYNVTARYGGDATYGVSTSAPVAVTIAKENSVNYAETDYYSAVTGPNYGQTTFTYGQPVFIDSEMAGVSWNPNASGAFGPINRPNTGTPTGTLLHTLTQNGTTVLPTLTTTLDGGGLTYLLAGGTFPAYYIYQNYPLLTAGTYTAKLDYSGDNSFNPNSTTLNFIINKAPTTPSVSVRTPDVTSGATAVIAVSLPPASGGINAAGTALLQTGAYPTGTVTLTDVTVTPNVVVGTGSPVNGIATITTNLLTTLGAHKLQASYAGDSNYVAYTGTATGTNGTVTVVVGTAPAITLSSPTASPVVLGTTQVVATVPSGTTGTVTFFDGGNYLGAATISSSTLTATYTSATWTAGTHVITATTAGTATLPAGSSTSPLTIVVAKNSPTLTITVEKTAVAGSTLLIQSRVNTNPAAPAAGGNPPPTGSVTFYDNGTAIGTAPIVYVSNYGSYTATYSGTVTAGTHKYTAQYPGDANYNASPTTASTTTTAAAPDFNIAATPSSLNIVQGQAGLTSVSITGVAYWGGSVSLSCSGLPQYSYCNFGAASSALPGVAFNETATPIVVSIVTVAPTPPVFAGLMWIPAVFFAGFLIIRRKHLSLHGRQLLTLAVLLCGVTALSGCGKGTARTGVQNGTPLGAATVTITGTGTVASGAAGTSGTKSIALPINVVAN